MSDNLIKCINPATLEEFASVPITSPAKVIELVGKARSVRPAWSRLSYKQRAAYLLRARDHLLTNIDDFARAITIDNGKPLLESLTAEIYPIADLIYYFAHNTEKILRKRSIPIGVWRLLGRSSVLEYQPQGVIGIISPWNYPFSIPVGTAVMALMAGNCVVLKPSSSTAYVGQKIEEMFLAAGLPEHTFIHVPGTSLTGQALLESPVNKIFFTGSTNVGHNVMNICSRRLTPCNLELGGKDAMIVMKDADIEHASSAAVWGAFTNAGQCCASVERVYVHKDISEKFIELVVEKTSRLKIGNGLEPDTDIGPLTTKSQLDTVLRHVEDARMKGAEILTGGERPAGLKGYFYKPTIITNVDQTFECVHEETFGPLMPIMTFDDDQQAIRYANDTPYGLNAYIWSQNLKKARLLASYLKCGTVCINECVYTHALPQTPWGGVSGSGFGRTHGTDGLKEMVNLHHVHTNRSTRYEDVWWYRYNANLYESFKKLTRLMTGCACSKLRAIPLFLKLALKKKFS